MISSIQEVDHADEKYLVDLTDDERTKLLALVHTGRTAARVVRRVNILLAVAAG